MTNNNLFHNNRKTFNSVVLILFLVIIPTFLAGMTYQGKENKIKGLQAELALAKEKVVYIEPDNPADYIKYVFGDDAPKAFLLLRGNSRCGGENHDLRWDAQNYNSDGSVDIGIFQINTKWQKVQSKFLYNFKTNINIAHQLYEESGKSFKLWTAGKCMGI